MAKISSSHRDSRHLAAGGQLDFSHLLTEPKDSSTFDCTERNQGWMDCRTLGDIQNSMKFYYLSDMKIVLKSLEFYRWTFKIFKIQCSSIVDHENN